MMNKTDFNLNGVIIGLEGHGFTAFYKEFPNVFGQGNTSEDAEKDLDVQLGFYLEVQKELTEENNQLPNKYVAFTKQLIAVPQ